MLKQKIFFLFMLLFCFVFQGVAGAASLYYILDGSGSMWGRIDGEMKIVAAKRVMTRLISEMPAGVDSGLTVYGHRRKGDCSDITEIIALGPLDREKAISAIDLIKPKGKTPIAASIKQVAEQLRGMESETTIVLVSDGIETCGGDPCALTKILKESGIKFIIHTVGLDVDKAASDQLACIAAAGGGSYFSVANAGELLDTLSLVQKSILSQTPIGVPEPAPEPEEIKQPVSVAGSSKSVRIKIKRPGRISFKYQSWLKKPYYWKLIDPETGAEKGSFQTLETTMVPVGEYQLAWKQDQHHSSEVILAEVVKVESGEEVEIPLFTALRLNLPTWVNKPYFWALHDPQTGEEVVRFEKVEPYLVPAGAYDLVWQQHQHHCPRVVLQRVNLEPDKLNDVEVSTAFNPVPADWVQKKIYYWELKKIDEKNAKTEVLKFSGQFTPQMVSAGRYQLAYRFSQHGSTSSLLGEVEVATGEMNEFAINTGVAFILPAGVVSPYLIEFVELDKSGNEGRKVQLNGDYLKGKFGPIALAPGTYKINYQQKQHGSAKVTIVESFALPAGNLVEIEL